MISINAGALKLSLAKLKTVRKKIADTADGRYRQKLFYAIELAARVSPQFSGDFASNWNIVVDGNMPVYKPLPGKLGVGTTARMSPEGFVSYHLAAHKAGDSEAITTTLARAAAQLRGVTIKSRVHIVNATDLYTDGTRMIGPDGPVNLRGDNIIPGRVRIEAYVRARIKEM
jgi:hypothetical protein